MKRLLVLLTLCVLPITSQGDPARTGPVDRTPDGVVANPNNTDLTFPSIAEDQSRTWTPRINEWYCITYPDGTTSCEYSSTECNCKRKCETGGFTCRLTGDWVDKCRIGTDNMCHSCEKDCGG